MTMRVMILAMVLIGTLTDASPATAREFRLGLITPPTHLWTEAAIRFGEALEAATEGEHTLAVFPARQLGTEAQLLQLLQTGALDFAILTISEVSNRLPQFGAFYAPYLVADVGEAAALLRGSTAQRMLDALPQELGVFGLGYCLAGMRQILSRDALAAPTDLGGQKIRITPFVPLRDFYQLLGAAPTPMPLASVYDALTNGQIDAIDMDLEAIWKVRYYESADTLMLSNHMMFPSVGVISGRTWLRLSEADRELVGRLMRTHLDRVMDEYVEQERQWEVDLRGAGVDVVDVGAASFGSAIAEWEALWLPQAPVLATLKAEAAANADRSRPR
jgi:TRAP-type C4-dicarboxylate transport system substrate-binding protein|tara:strand:- start:2126 stop:3121 length:996 start_codon:yes stop_codon:yes gene_type:complete